MKLRQGYSSLFSEREHLYLPCQAVAMKKLQLLIASPRGFCAGVVRAIATVENMLQQYGPPVYVLHEIVHNTHVINDLSRQGAVFVDELEQIPAKRICIFSAHGVSKGTEELARQYRLATVDGTCPLVASIHRAVEKYSADGYDIVIIGHHKHPEVLGTAGRASSSVFIISDEKEAWDLTLTNPDRCIYVTQTTLSQMDIEEIKRVLHNRYPAITSPKATVCYATQNRQDAVHKLAERCDLILVVGSKNSSNSNRLREVAERSGVQSYLIDDSSDIDQKWFAEKRRVGITAGASAPERLVEEVIAWISERYQCSCEEMQGEEKRVHFKPAELEAHPF